MITDVVSNAEDEFEEEKNETESSVSNTSIMKFVTIIIDVIKALVDITDFSLKYIIKNILQYVSVFFEGLEGNNETNMSTPNSRSVSNRSLYEN